jgi:hypothetical protein
MIKNTIKTLRTIKKLILSIKKTKNFKEKIAIAELKKHYSELSKSLEKALNN